MDTNIRAMLQLTSSVSLGYLLDNADLDISVVRENDMSYLNYDLTKDKELEDMMSAGLVPMTYPDLDRKSTRLNSSHSGESRMPSSA